ncbi:MAG: hypothetical protein WC379_16890 [Methanoregula sp.]|jgi:hypothetical protein
MPEQGNPISPPDAPPLTGGPDQQVPDGIPHIRALQVAFNSASKFYELESGDLLIRDVPLLAEGEWTDSAQKTPLLYPAKTLEAYAGNWIRRTGYNRHMGGVPRDESNRVSEAINPHFGHFVDEEGTTRAAVLSDLLVYGNTPSGRAMQEMIKRKNIRFVSVEHGGDEAENPQTRRMEAASLVFGGFAFVNKGACKVCRINEAAEETPKEPAPAAVPAEETMDTKELEAQIATQGTLIKELSEAIKAQKPAEVKVEIPKELSEAVSTIKELAARIDALEKDGTPKTGAENTKELSALPEFYIPVDRKKGTVGVQ